MHDTLTTPRFIGRRIQPADLPDYTRLNRDQRVMRTMLAEHDPASDEQIGRDFAQRLAQWERGEPAAWIWRARDDGRFISVGGLQRYGTDGVEIIYAALPGEWGQGFATEIGTAILDTAFGTMGLPEVVCFILPTNGASRQIMQKLGFAYDAPRLHAGLPHIFYRLKRETWAEIRHAIDWRTEYSTPDIATE